MSKRTVPDLKELFKQASEIAQQVPESMQQAAFNRAIDLLTGGTKPEPILEQTTSKSGRRKTQSKQTDVDVTGDGPISDDLLEAIDSTQHPGVTSATTTLDRSLMILQIALTDHNVDGLMPSEIAKILTNKFRVSTAGGAVSMALGRATTLVNRVSSGHGYSYRIMKPGEEYLTHLGETKKAPSSPPKKQRSKKKIVVKDHSNKKKTVEKDSKTDKSYKKSMPKAGGVGPKSAIISLIDTGFFSKGRTAPEIQTFLKSKRGFSFGIAQLSLAMLRLVRDERLDRDANVEGQYEYKKPGSQS